MQPGLLTRASLFCFALLAFLAWRAPDAHAQVNTADLRGKVTVAEDGAPMPETEVTLLHEPSGNVKTTTTNGDGVYVFAGLRVGGPYRITAVFSGFAPIEVKDIFLSAGRTRDVPLLLKLAEEVIEVSGTATPRATSGRTVIGARDIANLPTVGRDPKDIVRLTPEASVEGRERSLSIGGANNRFNSVTIDGVRQDDDFGLNASGYPSRRSPIGLGAIEEIAIELSPFDVRYGKFTGGNVNIVTKTGTNDFHGEVFGTYAGDSLIGNRSRKNAIDLDFSEVRWGGTLGGPIIKDKLHFLVNVEGLDATSPVDVGPADSGATNTVSRVTSDDLARAQTIAREVYGFDAGVASRSLDETDYKVLGKLDWAINPKHRLSAIYQRTKGNSIANTTSSDTTLALSSNWYDAKDGLHSGSLRLFSDWTDKLSTEIELSGKLVESRPTPLNGTNFSAMTVRTATGGTILLGPDESRHANELDNDWLHGKVQAKYLAGDHLFTAGLEYETVGIRNLFVAQSKGVAEFASIDAFAAQTPRSIAYADSVTGNTNDAAAEFNTGTITAYLQDQFKINPQLTIQAGVRLERLTAEDNITENTNFVQRYGFSNTETLGGRTLIMPRVGASYLALPELNLRTGVGLYSGGTPGVWVSNNYTNDGVTIDSAFSMDPLVVNGFDGRTIPQALKDMLTPGDGNVDALDPDFKIPSVWKVGGGADYTLNAGPVRNIEIKGNYVYSHVQNGVMWQDLRRDLALLPNNLPVGVTPDGRPLYDNVADGGQYNTRRGYDMLLTNTKRGSGHVASVSAAKGFNFGLLVAGSYAYQNVKEVSPGTSSRSVSNYGLAAVINPQVPENATSNYERAHRLTGMLSFSRSLFGDAWPCACRAVRDMKTNIAVFAELRSGQPYSYTFADAANGDNLSRIFGEEREFARRNRQLFYVPTGDGSDVTLMGIDEDQFNAYLKKTGLDKYRGKIAPRNAFRSPWITRIDARLSQDLPHPLPGHRARMVVDVENVGNLLNDNWGRVTGVGFPYTTPSVDVNYDAATGKYIYSNLRVKNPNQVDVLQSVWKVSLGLMYEF